RAFNSMIERLRIAVEKQKNYAAHLSHEIKTPITRMVSSLEVVLYNLGKVPDNDNIQITRSVRDELLSLGKLTDSILAATGNTLSVHSEEKNILSLSKELNSSLSDYEADIKRRKIKTVINCDKSIRIKISKEHMTIILSNLLSNAVKYSKQGGVISMGCINDNGIVSLSVYNMGPKIKDAEKTLIFKRFFRGSFHRNVAEGTGLGLALVQEICALDNLQISLNSSEYGTIFTVSGFQILS
ncbi:MAG: signal transduction histidine kinase, partial [Candidatus Gottesmanbacteria bacterium GW2011_GWC2_39_8]